MTTDGTSVRAQRILAVRESGEPLIAAALKTLADEIDRLWEVVARLREAGEMMATNNLNFGGVLAGTQEWVQELENQLKSAPTGNGDSETASGTTPTCGSTGDGDVTPEMIEAGADEIFVCLDDETRHEVAERVLRRAGEEWVTKAMINAGRLVVYDAVGCFPTDDEMMRIFRIMYAVACGEERP
jgi:hypothetical protein